MESWKFDADYSCSTTPFEGAMFQGLNVHLWLVATQLDSSVLACSILPSFSFCLERDLVGWYLISFITLLSSCILSFGRKGTSSK